MPAVCSFCRRMVKIDEKYFRSENGEFCHKDCLMIRLERMRHRGVSQEVIDRIKESFDPTPKKKKGFFFKA